MLARRAAFGYNNTVTPPRPRSPVPSTRRKTPAVAPPVFDAQAIADAVARKLADAAKPLTFAEVKKGLPGAPQKNSPREAEFDAVVHRSLEAVSKYPSGKDEADRYWHQDEADLLRNAAIEAAREPQAISKLVSAAKVVTKATPGFVEGLVRDLIGDDRLHEYKTKKGGPNYGSKPPPAPPPPPPPLPPLERAPFKKKLDTALNGLTKLLEDSGASAHDLLRAIQARLGVELPGERRPPTGPALPEAELERLILSKLKTVGPNRVASIAELRGAMPETARGEAFDRAVFRLFAAQRVWIYQDSNPAALTAAERAEFLPDEFGHVFRTIALRGSN